MMRLYYTPPSDAAFEDMKKCALIIWNRYEEETYRSEKVNSIKDIGNVGDNFMYMFAMFDDRNQRECAFLLEESTKDALRERMRDGGNPEFVIDRVLGPTI